MLDQIAAPILAGLSVQPGGDAMDGLLPASFRGVPFWVPDASHQVGRRIVAHVFPGKDGQIHEDLGARDGDIRLSGLIVGDDYVQQGRRLHAALRTPGAGTLSHPWLGELRVVVVREAEIGFSAGELRVVRFTATFAPAADALPQALDTLGDLLAAADAALAAIRVLMRAALRGPLSIGALRLLDSGSRAAAGAWRGAIAAAPAAFADAARSGLADLDTLSTIPAGADAAQVTADRLAAVPAAIAGRAMPMPAPAIAPGPVPAARDPGPAPRVAFDLLLAAASGFSGGQISAGLAATPLGRALALASETAALAQACRLSGMIDHDSRQQATALRGRALAALAAAGDRSAALARDLGAPAGATGRTLAGLATALAADINDRIGRLPAVRTLTPPGPVPAWLLAQHLSGDAPAQVPAMAADIVRRNRIRHPGIVPAEPLEVLA